LTDGQNHIVNSGTIQGTIVIRHGDGTGFNHVNQLENGATGVIASSGTALHVAKSLATTELVINDGAIYGDMNPHAMTDIVTNRGTISGIVNLGGGADLYGGGAVDGSVHGGGGNDLLEGGANNDNLDGGTGADTLYGHGGDDVLAGGDGRDLIIAGAGNDYIYGGSGGDVMTGGAGNDRFFFKSLSDFGGHGHDLITDATIAKRLPAAVSRLWLASSL
jgi:serralysin